MSVTMLQLGLFAGKVAILFLFILLLLIAFFSLLAKSKEKVKGQLVIKNLNQKYAEMTEALLREVAPKKALKRFFKDQKQKAKLREKNEESTKTVFVLTFLGDIKASAVAALAEEVTAVLNVAKPSDEVVLRLESAGGVVHGYGLAAAQLMRIRARQIPLTVVIDKIAASGGYMMACVANNILAAPFAIIGSIGVVVQLPNFNRLLKKNDIDYEQHTAGEFKRTITLFGENTEEGREKLQHEIEDIHQLFKNLIAEHRSQLDIQQVATGEHWLGQQALLLKLIDVIQTSDDYLLEKSRQANVYDVQYVVKKPFLTKLSAGVQALLNRYSL